MTGKQEFSKVDKEDKAWAKMRFLNKLLKQKVASLEEEIARLLNPDETNRRKS